MNEMTMEQIDARLLEIRSLVDSNAEGADFEELSKEVDELNARKVTLAEEQRKADIQAVLDGAGEELVMEETNTMEFRNSKEYLDAFAEMIKTGSDAEVRALLSKNAPEDGQISVPTIVEEKIRTAWEKSDLFSRISKSEVKGNLIIDFEISGTDAVIHEEGTAAPDEEDLEIGSVTIVPKNIKKWISISDEVMDLRGEAFLAYVYDELSYKIVKKAEAIAVAKILANLGASTAEKAGQSYIVAEIGRAGVVEAIAELSDEATDVVIMMSRRTWGQYEATRTLNTLDPFAELPVVYTSALPAYDTADAGDAYAIVGDLGFGMRANLPNGFNVKTILDEDGPGDKITVTGKLFAGIEPIAVNAFCAIEKPADES